MNDETLFRQVDVDQFQVPARSSLCDQLITILSDSADILAFPLNEALCHFFLGDAVLGEVIMMERESLHESRILILSTTSATALALPSARTNLRSIGHNRAALLGDGGQSLYYYKLPSQVRNWSEQRSVPALFGWSQI